MSRVKRFNAFLLVLKDKERKMMLKEAREKLGKKASDKKKETIGKRRPERWPNKCWQCCHRHYGGLGGIKLQAGTEKWLAFNKKGVTRQ